MKKLLLSISIASALGLTGCGGGESLEDVKNNSEPVVAASRVLFDPSNGVLSAPNDLLFSGTTDGTLNMPDESAAIAAGMAPDYSDPAVALGALDGWSTQNPFVINLAFDQGVSLNADSAQQPGSVRIYEVELTGPLSADAECQAAPQAGLPCKPIAELTFGVDFVTKAQGSGVAVVPLKPLKPATGYIVALTNQLSDSNGNALQPSSTYGLVKQDIETKPLATEAQLGLQKVINNYENIVQSFGVDKEAIIYTSAMTTQSVGNVLGTVKQLMAANPAQMPAVSVTNTGVTVFDALVSQQLLDPTDPNSAVFKTAQLYSGSITVPYYLGTPTLELDAEGNPSVNFTPWSAACDSAATLAGFVAQGGEIPQQPVSENDGFCQLVSSGTLRDLGVDTARHLTKYNTIPEVKSLQTLDVQMTTPDMTMMNGVRASLGLSPLTMPEAGWPVVMLQHGITSKKEDMLAITGALSLQGFATVAIDHPLHGSRGFDLTGDGVDEVNASTVSATHYLNLADLLIGRDNLRQSVSDMLALRLGLNMTTGADVDGSTVYVLGHSLGAISSTKFTAVTNAPTGVPMLDASYQVKAASLAMPGGGIAPLLIESGSFGDLVKGSVLLGTGDNISAELAAFIENQPDAACIPLAASAEAYAACQTDAYLTQLVTNGESAKLAQVSSTMASFTFAAQTVIDAGDPNNYAQHIVVNETPVHMIEVVGDGDQNLSDQVIPNQTVNTPLGGTEPLAGIMMLNGISDTTAVAEGNVSGIVRFTKGHHSSILDPRTRDSSPDAAMSARATAEMQQQVATYFASGAKVISVTDSEVVAGN
ncbi:VolA/Pla-1 family phospholipase [Flocculibacter collagenilyticus]|uniref:VolA/Pla-1 family phospholipase n=1 Tax=Flocculibacter collagenilyticus TaxID=2744479 RepID=UPI0018F4FADD|nr:VolA/Pla-1 family phospholipase [Flocculibacter collagenilyticus]